MSSRFSSSYRFSFFFLNLGTTRSWLTKLFSPGFDSKRAHSDLLKALPQGGAPGKELTREEKRKLVEPFTYVSFDVSRVLHIETDNRGRSHIG